MHRIGGVEINDVPRTACFTFYFFHQCIIIGVNFDWRSSFIYLQGIGGVILVILFSIGAREQAIFAIVFQDFCDSKGYENVDELLTM